MNCICISLEILKGIYCVKKVKVFSFFNEIKLKACEKSRTRREMAERCKKQDKIATMLAIIEPRNLVSRLVSLESIPNLDVATKKIYAIDFGFREFP